MTEQAIRQIDGKSLSTHGRTIHRVIFGNDDAHASSSRHDPHQGGRRQGRRGSNYCLNAVHDENGKPSSFSLQDDLALLGEKVGEVGDVALIVIDPITAYLGAGRIDTHRKAMDFLREEFFASAPRPVILRNSPRRRTGKP
jgi:hypothetical protein